MDKKTEMQKLKDQMESDETLPLKKGATKLVFGSGNLNTKTLFIGEGPGFHEDQKGEPFVGNAGSLLNRLLSSIELAREKVFITNVVHHRPLNNRDPEPAEIAAYGKYLDKIIAIINPKIIVTLGRFSMGKFLPGAKISVVHGKVEKVIWKGKEIIVVPMYHPAAALRNGAVMRQIEQDFKKLPEVLEQVTKPEINQMNLV